MDFVYNAEFQELNVNFHNVICVFNFMAITAPFNPPYHINKYVARFYPIIVVTLFVCEQSIYSDIMIQIWNSFFIL